MKQLKIDPRFFETTVFTDKQIVVPKKIFVDASCDAITPRWWHKLIFWKKWKYQSFHMVRQFVSLKQII